MITNFLNKAGLLFIDNLKYVASLLFAIVMDIQIVAIGMVVLVIGNQISGVIKAVKGFAKDPFKWKIFNSFYTKVLLYNVCVISAHVFEHLILDSQDYYFTKGIAVIMGVQELYSIVENTGIVFGKDFIGKFKNVIQVINKFKK